MASFTNKEIDALRQFRSMVADLGLNEEQNSDHFLIRWLRARELNLNLAEEMLRKSMAWRKDCKIDDILSWEAPPQFVHDFAYDMEGCDKDGSPVIIIPWGKWDIRKAVESGQKDIYLKYFDQLLERALDIMRKKNKSRPPNDPVTQICIICDLNGFSMRQITARGPVDAIMEVTKKFEANYPEILKTAFNINSPRIFALLFALIKPILTPRTLDKIQIHGPKSSKWMAALLKKIPADQLPPSYGGSRAPSKLLSHFMDDKGHSGSEDSTGDSMCVVTVEAGETLDIALDVKHPNSTLSWSFSTDEFDIGFSLYFNGTDKIVAEERVDSHVDKQQGTHACSKAGRYTLRFDNTYSLVRAKTLYYMISVTSPEDDDDTANY